MDEEELVAAKLKSNILLDSLEIANFFSSPVASFVLLLLIMSC